MLVFTAPTFATSFNNFSAKGWSAPDVSIMKGRKFLLLTNAKSEYLVFLDWNLASAALNFFFACEILKFVILPFCIPINGDTNEISNNNVN